MAPSPKPRPELWRGREPLLGDALFPNGRSVLRGLWHTRQVQAWKRAWTSHLVETVQHHGAGLYTVPSQSEAGKWYCVHRYPLAPDGYLYVCDCAASEKGGVVCAHGFAVYLWRLRHVLKWRLKEP